MTETALVPFKFGTDITLIGNTYAPNRIASKTWLAGIKVGKYQKLLRVYGRRFWIPFTTDGTITNWILSDAETTDHVPLDWRLAYGGKIPHANDDTEEVYTYNPLGRGIVDLEHFLPNDYVPAPQIGAADVPIKEWRKIYKPECFAPISAWWKQRQQYAGTYDNDWKNTRHPLLPKDFDYHFYQYASADMVAIPYLLGNEQIELTNLTPPAVLLKSRLPNLQFQMRLKRDRRFAYANLVLDSVHFDFRPEVKLVFLTWRVGFPWPDGKGLPELAMVKNGYPEND